MRCSCRAMRAIPSLCNDNLSGVALVGRLAELLHGVSLEYSYRFLFIPGTIGAITWLAATSTGRRGSAMAWWSRVSATPASSTTNDRAAATPRSIEP